MLSTPISTRKGRIAKRLEKALVARAMQHDIAKLHTKYRAILDNVIFQIFDVWGYKGTRIFAELSGLHARYVNRIAYTRQESRHLREGYLQHLPAVKTEEYIAPGDNVAVYELAGQAIMPSKHGEAKITATRRPMPPPQRPPDDIMRHRIGQLADTYQAEIYDLFWYMGVKYGEYGIVALGTSLHIPPPDPHKMLQLIQRRLARR